MKVRTLTLLALILSVAAFDLSASNWRPVVGTYAVTAKDYLDPPEGEPKDTHLRLQLSGETAKDLYLAMKVAEKPDQCIDAIAKRIGEMQCLHYKNEKKYACHFSVNIAEQTIEYGVAC